MTNYSHGATVGGLALSVAFLLVTAFAVPSVAASKKNSVIVVGNARFTVIAPECIRLEYSKDAKFIDEPSMFAANRDASFTGFKHEIKDLSTVIDTGKIRLEYKPDGQPFSKANLWAVIKNGDKSVEWNPGMRNTKNLGGTIRTVDGVAGPVDLGEGVLSRNGWYLLDDSKRQLFTSDWVVSRPKSAGTDWYLFGYGADYLAGIRAMTAIGGDIPLPRKYSLGAWYSRYWPYSSKDYHDIIDEYRKNDFPIDVIVMDMDWHKDGWTGWSWNRKLLPDAEELLKWFHRKGLAVTLNLHPADGVGPHEDMYEPFMKDMGADPASKKTITYDSGDKKYLDTLFKYAIEPHEREGVDFWWLDWQQYQNTISIPDLTNLAWLNHYFFTHTGSGPRRGLSFSRWAGWGDHRYPIHFSGDSHTGWPMLAFEVPLTSTAGNIGAFFWSHDIGGHMGPRNEESYARWVQFGATTAALRSHSTRSAEMDRRPWKYPKWATDSMRRSFHLRSEIFPYIYSSARQSAVTSVPLNRPLYLSKPNNEKSYRNPQEYLYGDAFLAAPIAMLGVGPKRVGRQVVFFPDGVWYNWFSGERYRAGDEAVVTADIDEFPLYAKGGTPIPMQPYSPRMATAPLKNLIVRCYPGENGKSGAFTLYEDDGASNGYKKGEFALTPLRYSRKGDTATIVIGSAKGTYKGQLKKRAITVELPCTKKALSANVNGKPVDAQYDEKAQINRIQIPASSVTNGFKVTVRAQDADFEALRRSAAMRRIRGVSSDASKEKDIAKALARIADKDSDTDEFRMALASSGVGIVKKNEGLYLYNGISRQYFYAAPGVIDGNKFRMTIVDIVGDQQTPVKTVEMKITGNKAFGPPALPALQPASTFGLETVRAMSIEFTIGGKPFTLVGFVDEKPSYLTKWSVVGPFPYDTGKPLGFQMYEPETKPIAFNAVYKGFGGVGLKWRTARVGADGLVDLNDNFHIPGDNRIAYGVTYLQSDAEQPVTFSFNNDDGLEAFLNGKKIYTNDGSRGTNDDAGIAKTTLRAGRNKLVVKVSQHTADWMFRVSVGASKPLTNITGRQNDKNE